MAVEQRQIQWGTAEIDDGSLTVELGGASSKSWKARFENVLALLDTPHRGWGEVSLTRKAIKVSGSQHGSEAEQRHFLESAVLQANTDTAPSAPSPHDAEDEEPDADEEMAQTFRSFAVEHQHC